MTLLDRLVARKADLTSYRPRFFRLPDDEAALDALLDAHPGAVVHDQLRESVRGLLETRDPEGTLDAAGLERAVDAHLGPAPDHYGVWTWFPWSKRLIRILPESEYRELRTSRNRNKITIAEQERLRSLSIGLVGLSIGQAAAVTLALEEVGGLLVMADFDHLELSNMNRLRAGVHGLGVNKAILAAREVFEINPYLSVQVFLEGVNADNLDAFLLPDGRPLDMVFEECDDLQSKFRVRERARALGIPVLMETSDRGLMDVERFDLEPDRPLFHGLVGEVDLNGLAGMSKREKVPLMLRIIGEDGMSDRMKASMIDIDTTLKSWPQLASEVALGAGINVDSARRIALGEFNVSGRFYLDMHQVLHDGAERIQPWVPPAERQLPNAHTLPPLCPVSSIDRDAVRVLAAWMTTAFSGGNMQPWTLLHVGDTLQIHHDRERSASILDVDDRASHLAFGGMLEIAELVAPALGVAVDVRRFPTPQDPTHVATLSLTLGAAAAIDPLVHALPDRVANRRIGPRVPVDDALRDALASEARHHGAALSWVTEPLDLGELARCVGRCDRIRLTDPRAHAELMSEIRWTEEDVQGSRDGIDIETLELLPPDRAGIGLMRRFSMIDTAVSLGGGEGMIRGARASVTSASAMVLLDVEGTEPEDFLRLGRALLRVWTRANQCGWALQPWTPITFLLYRALQCGGRDLSPWAVEELGEIALRFRALYPEGRPASFLFRLARVPKESGRSLRRPLEDVLVHA